VTIGIVGTASAATVIHLVETVSDIQEETHVIAVPPMLPTNLAHLQLTEGAKAHLVTVGEPHRLLGTEVVLLPAREIVDAPRLIRRIEGTRLPQRQARIANPPSDEQLLPASLPHPSNDPTLDVLFFDVLPATRAVKAT
jgi:hypothetical protein